MFARRPEWLSEFAVVTLQKGGSTANLALALRPIGDLASLGVPNLERSLIDQLVAEREFQAAREFAFSRLPGSAGDAQLVAAPNFQAGRVSPPFGWDLIAQSGLGAEQGKSGLALYANVAEGGAVASQLLTLRPGRYQLRSSGSARAEDAYGGARWTVACAAEGAPTLVELPLPRDRLSTVRASFVVPPKACEGQWLRLAVVPTDAPRGVAGTVRFVDVQPQR